MSIKKINEYQCHSFSGNRSGMITGLQLLLPRCAGIHNSFTHVITKHHKQSLLKCIPVSLAEVEELLFNLAIHSLILFYNNIKNAAGTSYVKVFKFTLLWYFVRNK